MKQHISRRPNTRVITPIQIKTTAFIDAAEKTLPTFKGPDKKEQMSEETKTILAERQNAILAHNGETVKELTKKLKKSKRKDRRNLLLEAVSKDLDVRSQWLGIRQLKKTYTGNPFSRKTADVKHIPMHQRANETAKFLANKIWVGSEANREARAEDIWPFEDYPALYEQTIGIDVGPIRMEELIAVIRKMKRRKAPGPDQVPIELFKEMYTRNLMEVLALLNEWWAEETIPAEVLLARVVLIFKKGNANDLGNYRPISLLNSVYKILAAIIQKRLESKLDDKLQRTQFGFRRKRSTADAILCIRRIIDKGEMTQSKTLLVLLDWEKAFDTVSHIGLFTILKRLGVETKVINLIKAIYNNPSFYVDTDGMQSTVMTQKAGIRQGCPLSLYLFIALMTVLFHDIHRIHNPNTDRSRIQGMDYDEVLYADDTICISESEAVLEKVLRAIVTEGEKYGMKLNKNKCELLAFGKVRQVKFSDGKTRLDTWAVI